MSDDQIAYVSQSADHREGVIIKTIRGNEVCRAAILRKNYSHTDTKLYIAFDASNATKVQERFKKYFECNNNVFVNVMFDLKNSYFRTLSQSVNSIPSSVIRRIMPQFQSLCEFYHRPKDFNQHLPKGSFSDDQLKALEMIICSPSNGPPCIVTGPFGTGKSHLLAAAAYWVFKNSLVTKKPSRILVCTQQRESADSFCILYRGLMAKEKDANVFIVREYGYQNRKLKQYYTSIANFEISLKKLLKANSGDIQNFLVIMPCLTAPKLQRAGYLPLDFFTHIFIDEGSQMREPEALAPLSMASDETKIVIAGDPWQVQFINNNVLVEVP